MRHAHRGWSVVLALFLSLVLAGTALASTFQYGTSSGYVCGSFMIGNAVCFKEDSGLGGDNMLIQQGTIQFNNLNGYTVTTDDQRCNTGFGNTPYWNDCISSFMLNLQSGYAFCAYINAGYGQRTFYTTGPKTQRVYNAGTDFSNDNISSFKLVAGSTC